MLAEARSGRSVLIYAGNRDANDVDVYDYSNGKLVGTLTGFYEPYGMCVDAKGDVYITSYRSGTLVEYAHGGVTPLQTYKPGGYMIGCSIDSSGDVAATSFKEPGEVTVYAHGNPNKATTYSDSDCESQSAMGYDNRGNLVGVGENEYGKISVCALLVGSKSMTTLAEKGITIGFPGGTIWDGKYIALGDQDASGSGETGVWPTTISGTTITAIGSEITFSSSCPGYGDDDINPFIVGKENTPVNDHRGSAFVGVNTSCLFGWSLSLWHYPEGGTSFKSYKVNVPYTYGLAVSIGRSK